jgi:hypothetical protein
MGMRQNGPVRPGSGSQWKLELASGGQNKTKTGERHRTSMWSTDWPRGRREGDRPTHVLRSVHMQTRITRQRCPALCWGGPAFRFRPRDLLYWLSSVPPSKCLEFGNTVSFHMRSSSLFINNHNMRRYIVGATIDNVVN